MNHYPRHIGDYLRDTGHLSLLEHGVYSRLLDLYYLNNGPLQLTVDDAIRKLCARAQDEREAVERVLREFFSHCNGVWSHKRADKELEKYRSLSEQQRARVSKRWSKNTDGIPTVSETVPTVSESIPQEYQVPYTGAGIPTKNQEPRTSNQVIPPTPFKGAVAAVAAPRVRKSAWGHPLDGLPAVLNVPEFVNVWLEYIAYKKKQSAKTLPSRTRVFAKAVEVGVPAAIAGMIQSMEKGWSGIHIETKTNAKLEKRSGECPESIDVPVF